MEKKINILFDATILVNVLEANAGRSGIFFTALNILTELVRRDDCNVSLYCNRNILASLDCAIENELSQFRSCPVITNMPITYAERCAERAFYNKQRSREKGHKLKKQYYHYQRLFYSVLCKIERLFKNSDNRDIDLTGIDCFLSPVFTVPSEIRDADIRNWVILYDTIPLLLPEFFENGSIWFINLLNDLNKRDNYFAISESAKQDFLKFAPVLSPEQILVTPLACADNFVSCPDRVTDIRKKYNIPSDKKYIFSLCSLEPRKNLIRAVKTFLAFIKKNNIDDLVFVLGGGAWNGFIEKLESQVPDYDKSKIIRIGYVSDDDLAPLYSGAQWFVYTSQYEGFGLPPLEAMSCGCPVITSNNSSLPEVVGDSGIMIDWDNDDQHIAAYERYYFDSKFRKQMADKGLARSKMFSWKKCVDMMVSDMKKYQQVLSITDKDREQFYIEKMRQEYNPENKIAVFSTLPPDESGIALYTLRTHATVPEKYDLIGDICRESDYTNLKSAVPDIGIFPYTFYLSQSDRKYLAKLFVIGNSFHNTPALRHAIATRGEKNRFLYLHEAMIHGAYGKQLWKQACTIPYCGELNLGVNALVEMSGIYHIFVNNDLARELILKNLTPENRERVTIDILFLPIDNLHDVAKGTLTKNNQTVIIGSFGIPNESKQTYEIIRVIQHIRETKNIDVRLCLAGYNATKWLNARFEIVPEFIDVYDSPGDTELVKIMRSVDCAVQLRRNPSGETSGCIMQLLGMGQNIITTSGFVPREFEQYCTTVPSDVSSEKLAETILDCIKEPKIVPDNLPERYSFKNLGTIFYDKITDALETDK